MVLTPQHSTEPPPPGSSGKGRLSREEKQLKRDVERAIKESASSSPPENCQEEDSGKNEDKEEMESRRMKGTLSGTLPTQSGNGKYVSYVKRNYTIY